LVLGNARDIFRRLRRLVVARFYSQKMRKRKRLSRRSRPKSRPMRLLNGGVR
jgi:hypothetical protein